MKILKSLATGLLVIISSGVIDTALLAAGNKASPEKMTLENQQVGVGFITIKRGECEDGAAKIQRCSGTALANSNDLVLTVGHCVLENAFNFEVDPATRKPAKEIYVFKNSDEMNKIFPDYRPGPEGHDYECISSTELKSVRKLIKASSAIKATEKAAVIEAHPAAGTFVNDFAIFRASGLNYNGALLAKQMPSSGSEILGVAFGTKDCSRSVENYNVVDYSASKLYTSSIYFGTLLSVETAEIPGMGQASSFVASDAAWGGFSSAVLNEGYMQLSMENGPFNCIGDSGMGLMTVDSNHDWSVFGLHIGGDAASNFAQKACAEGQDCTIEGFRQGDQFAVGAGPTVTSSYFCEFVKTTKNVDLKRIVKEANLCVLGQTP